MVNSALPFEPSAAGADAARLDRLREGLAACDPLRVDLHEAVGFGTDGRAAVPSAGAGIVNGHRVRTVLDHIARAFAARMMDLDHLARITQAHRLERLLQIGRASFRERVCEDG